MAILIRNAPWAHAANIVVSLVLVYAIAITAPEHRLVAAAWVSVVVAMSVFSIVEARRYRRALPEPPESARWMTRYRILTFAMASEWAAAIVLFVPGSASEPRLFVLACALGMVAGSVPIVAGTMFLVLTFGGTVMLAAIGVLLLAPIGPLDPLLALCSIMFLLVVIESARQLNRALIDSIRLGAERLALLESERDAHAEAARASRAKSEFLANMSHEVRTPMNTMIGTIDLVLADTTASEVPARLATLRRAARTLIETLNDVLDVERIEAGKLAIESSPFALASVLDEVLAIHRPACEAKRLALRLVRDGATPDWLVGDSLRLRQLLSNIVGNAVKFTERGYVELAVASVARDEASARLRFTIRDSGIGIPAEKHALVFERFTQVDTAATRRHGGSGLGLAISRDLVRLMGGGGIELASAEGLGSLFAFELPFRMAPRRTAPAIEPAGRITLPLHVLLADDNRSNLEIYSRLLERQGLVVKPVTDGVGVLEAIESEPFDAVILDLHMPGMGGIEIACRVREREAERGEPRRPIIMLSASVRPESREASLVAGADRYLAKPIDAGELRKAIARLCLSVPTGGR